MANLEQNHAVDNTDASLYGSQDEITVNGQWQECGTEQTRQKLPQEVLGDILQCLDPQDLKQCRLVNRAINHEATRFLFRTLHVQSNTSSYDPTDHILTHADLPTHMRSIKFEVCPDEILDMDHDDFMIQPNFPMIEACKPTFEQTMERIISRGDVAPGSLSLDCYSRDVKPLFSGNEAVRTFLQGIKSLRLVLKKDPGYHGYDDPMSQGWDASLIPGYLTLASLLPHLVELDIGFWGYVYSPGNFERTRQMTDSFLQCNWTQLKSLKLNTLAIDALNDDLIHFLERHSSTLKALTIQGLCFVFRELDNPSLRNEAVIFRFIIFLSQGTQLDEMTFGGEWMMGEIKNTWYQHSLRYTCRQHGDKMGPGSWDPNKIATGTLCPRFQDYVCCRGEFPFCDLRPYLQDIIDRKAAKKPSSPTLIFGGADPDTQVEAYFWDSDDTFSHCQSSWSQVPGHN